jgi:hypothetical protein
VDRSAAFRIIESLKLGIPPDGAIADFTVGRKEEMESLRCRVTTGDAGVLYLKANYGSGKTHLLRLLREYALNFGYAVSLVSLDASANVRFNRMDQIVGAIMRGLMVPGCSDMGVRPLFNLICQQIQTSRARGETDGFWWRLTNRWRWTESDVCESLLMFVALRAWATQVSGAQLLVEDLLFQPWSYYSQRKRIYKELISDLWRHFTDAHSERYYYPDGFKLNVANYDGSWKFLRDLRVLSAAAGLKGVIILFDEFENMLAGLRRRDYQIDAFWNLLKFGRQKEFPGLSAFAITPGFFQAIATAEEFKSFPMFEMQPLTADQLFELAVRIRSTHGVALDWDSQAGLSDTALRAVVYKAAGIPVQDRTRDTIKLVVKALDSAHSAFEDSV